MSAEININDTSVVDVDFSYAAAQVVLVQTPCSQNPNTAVQFERCQELACRVIDERTRSEYVRLIDPW